MSVFQPPLSHTGVSTRRVGQLVLVVSRVVLVVAILAFALAIRLYAVDWGLPYTDHPDEPSAVNRVFGMLKRDDWNPNFFGKPSLYYYALRLVFDAHLRYGEMKGMYTGIESLPETTDLFVTTPGFFVWGRTLTAVLGVSTVLLLYVVGRRWRGATVGGVAALMLAVLPFHIRNSQYITQDVPVTLMVLVALGAALYVLRRPTWLAYMLAGLAIGLAAGTKYNAALVAISLVAVHWFVWGRQSLRQFGRLVVAGSASVIGFVISTPYVLLAPAAFLKGLTHQYVAYNPTGGRETLTSWPILNYGQFFWESGLYPLGCVAAIVGIVVVIARRDRAGLALLAFIVPYPLMFLAQQIQFSRNLLPIVPPLLLFVGIGVVASVRWLIRIARQHWALPIGTRRWLIGGGVMILSALLVGAPLRDALAEAQYNHIKHSKVRAAEYISSHVNTGMPLFVALHPVQWAGQPLVVPLENVAEHDAEWYRAQGARYVLADVKKVNPEQYAALRHSAEDVVEFPGEAQGYPGPQLELLDLGDHPDALKIVSRDTSFGNQLRLLGFQAGSGSVRGAFAPLGTSTSVQRGQNLQLNIYWQTLAPIHSDQAIFLHLLDANGQTVAQRDTLIRADYPTSHWRSGEKVLDLADLALPAELPAGQYTLQFGVYDMTTMQRMDAAGTSNGAIELLTLTVE